MDNIKLKACGKINISLDVTGKRDDGYHLVSMIMQSVTLSDYVTISKTSNKEIQVHCDKNDVPEGRKNIAYRAAEKIIERYAINCGVKIEIEKNIPMAAGMAGGSTDAAAVIKGMNEIFNLQLSTSQMDYIALSLGADVPFCLRSGTYLAEGIGERLTKLNGIPPYDIIVVNPSIEVSTKEIYAGLDNCVDVKHPSTDNLLKYIKCGYWENLFDSMSNILEPVTREKCLDIEWIEKKLKEMGAIGSMMTGSGPTVFGVFSSKGMADRAADFFNSNYKNGKTFLCKMAE